MSRRWIVAIVVWGFAAVGLAAMFVAPTETATPWWIVLALVVVGAAVPLLGYGIDTISAGPEGFELDADEGEKGES